MFIPQGTLRAAEKDLAIAIDDIIEKRNDTEVYVPNMMSTVL